MNLSLRTALGLSTLSLLAVGWAWSPAGQDTPEIQVHPAAGKVSMLEGQGGNIGVSVGADGLLMIDSQYASMAPKIRAALDGLSTKQLRFLINTHWHGDHVGGNAIFGELTPIVAHSNVRVRMAKDAAAASALPMLTYDDALTLYFNGEEIEVRHIGPAHTDGDSLVWFKTSNVVHLGDCFFNQRFPFIDLDSGGSVRGLTQVITQLLATLPKDAILIPGHGPLATHADLAGYLKMLTGTQKLVAGALAAGKSAETMKQEQLLAEYASWSWQFISADRFIDTLVRESTAK
jgi:glyoxylase-like metal-dependent hydrolase (beta-lactamase superfamily II)